MLTELKKNDILRKRTNVLHDDKEVTKMSNAMSRYEKYSKKNYKLYAACGESLPDLMTKLQSFLKEGNENNCRRVPIILNSNESCILNSKGQKMFSTRKVANVEMFYEDIKLSDLITA